MDQMSVLWIPVLYMIGVICGWCAKTHPVSLLSRDEALDVTDRIVDEAFDGRHDNGAIYDLVRKQMAELHEYMEGDCDLDELSMPLQRIINSVKQNGNAK